MKLNKKTIIILVIVAVAGYLLWKRSKSSEYVSVGTITSESDHTTLDYILTHIDFNSTERNKIESVRQGAEASTVWKQQLQAKANQNGRSYDQQLVLSALWLLYHPEDKWTTDRGWKLQNEVLAL